MLLLGGLFLGGCYSTNRYDTAATMPSGKIRVTAASEVGRVSKERIDARFGSTQERHDFLALSPIAVARFAPTNGLELGATVGPTRLTVESKIRLMKELALAPGTGLLGDIFLVDVPVLFDVHLHERLTLVVSPGGSFAKPLASNENVRPEGWYLRAGAALRIEVFRFFALMPEITLMSSVTGPQSNWTTGGLSFQFGPFP